MIETFKITTGKVNYGQGLFRQSRSGVKILKNLRGDRILSNRIANYWNKIPGSVKEVNTVVAFKTNLEHYKMETIASGVSSQGHFWDLIEIILSKINDRSHD